MNKIIYFFKEAWSLLKETAGSWYGRSPFRDSTVISYYAIFSLPGLGVIVINLAGYFYGAEAITNEISTQVEGIIGSSTANRVESIIANAYTSEGLTFSSVVSIATLLFGATGVFYQIQQTLNNLWEVKPKPNQMILKFLRDRLFSFGIILIIGFLLIVSLILSSLINWFSDWLAVQFFGTIDLILRILDISISLAVITFLFAAIYKILPDARIKWSDVWVGAFVTSLLFVVAKYMLGLYFAISNPGSVYGAASSIILIMLWSTYSALIFLFGAEFTRVYAKRYGRKIKATEFAIPLFENDEEAQVAKQKEKYHSAKPTQT